MGTALPWKSMNSLSFKIYTADEIKQLSVKEVTNPQVFDSLLHPTIGGLYDPALGPSDRDDVCASCGLSAVFCPGHIGHIVLPLPVYNPVLFKTLIVVLRGSCFHCHQLLVSNAQVCLLEKQMELLEYGLVSQVHQLTEVYNNIRAEAGGAAGVDEEIQQALTATLTHALQDICKEDAKRKAHVKNVVELRQSVIKQFMSENFKPSKGKCRHCSKRVCPVRSEHNSKLFLQTEAERRKTLQNLRDLTNTDKKLQQRIQEKEKEQEVSEKPCSQGQTYLTAVEVRSHLREVWKNDARVLHTIFGGLDISYQDGAPTDVFFLEVLPVAPSRFRPISQMGDKRFENGQTANLVKVLTASVTMRQLLIGIKNQELTQTENENKMFEMIPGKTHNEKLQNTWIRLQTYVNGVIDSDLDKLSTDKSSGIKQLLEKKEGIFRKHMMGKRVNYAARSVISPDPYINTNEIGIPDVFAKKLTYPQPVTPWNVQELRQAVINGPMVHPGASLVEDENGNKTVLSATNKTQREAIAKQLMVSSGSKKVFRHLKNGDVLLLNRQPTLHRPSIQAHRARVLPGEKTLRLHYANCNAYNADFDGDEMNAHFPQNEIARSEAYALASTDFQYLVPKNGLPLAGLIQDHIIAGVKLTMRGRFFTRQDYQHLVFSALTDKKGRVIQLPPSIIKPQKLWSGKQVFSTLLLNIIPSGKKPLNLIGKTKISPKEWIRGPVNSDILSQFGVTSTSMSESEVIFREGQLMSGVTDKAHFGATPFGLVHCIYELYGGEVAGKILTCSAKLFTAFLQLVGFTLGVEDILVKDQANSERAALMSEGRHTGPRVARKAFNLQETDGLDEKYEESHFSKDDGELKDLDLSMKGNTDEYQNKIAKVCIPQGLHKRFPDNNLQLMVLAGAKGSQVNCMQISCLLGQIELEGRRPPLMMSGRFLPSFLPYETSPRSGGFVDGRFLTGIRPQEYFFHCMAGREGLVDTAVKTSRSGYLQRCIIKHLEGMVVNYDLTVRDSDGSIIQFQYGEDSADIAKSKVLSEQHFPFLISNQRLYLDEKQMSQVHQHMDADQAKAHWKKIKKWKKKNRKRDARKRQTPFVRFCTKNSTEEDFVRSKIGKCGRSEKCEALINQWRELSEEEKHKYEKYSPCPVPLMSRLRPDHYFGSVSEKIAEVSENYIMKNPSNLLCDDEEDLRPGQITSDRFKALIQLRSLTALSPPGESVGLLAAQSIGEPSTQMTLNTFHFAGRGEMNVTLGIPRLREILMVASANIKTPTMDIPVLDTPYARKHANQLKKKLNKVYLYQVLEDVEVVELLSVGDKRSRNRKRTYCITFHFLPHKMYKDEFYLNSPKILRYMETRFCKHLVESLNRRLGELANTRLLSTATSSRSKPTHNEEEVSEALGPTGDEDISDDDQNDGDATAEKHRQRQQDSNEYIGEDEEKQELNEKQESDMELEGDEVEKSLRSERLDDSADAEQSLPSSLDLFSKTPKKSKTKKAAEVDPKRINAVLSSSNCIEGYDYDADNEEWCEVTVQLGSLDTKLDMTSLVEQEARKCVVYQVPRITRCFLSESKKMGEEGQARLKTEGVNIHQMYAHDSILDLNKLYSNDIHGIAYTYGIEAARTVIVKEITDVFAAYGIGVDYRHLSLVADYMTFEGCYKPFNRIGMESNASPLQKMSFETTMHFLKSATITGACDDLKSPSARIVVGRVVTGGTGCFELLGQNILKN